MWSRALASVSLEAPVLALLGLSSAGFAAMAYAGHHASHTLICGTSALPGNAFAGALSWTLMLIAMMPPLLVHPVRRVWSSGLRRRRGAAIALFVSGYALVWMPGGAILQHAAASLDAHPPGIGSSGAVLAIAALWQALPIKGRFLALCHRAPTLRIFGAGAGVDQLRYGLTSGLGCFGACWGLMLLPLLTRWHLLAMAGVAVFATLERHRPRRGAPYLPVDGILPRRFGLRRSA